ncbi:hypothetical protein ACFPVY_16030 [Flavobacterium qiangtangense]|uniref:Lipoprotein n=1 Tax=Flavobacterium qiangtangense TaxID=1442595 RepID=A0ABW1PSS5_9FLAO
MKKLLLIFLIILFFSCSERKQNGLPKLIDSKVKNSIQVNSKEMLNIESFMPLAFNFDEDLKVKTLRHRFDSVRSKKIPFDSVIPKYNLKIVIDTSYFISNNWYVYNFVPRPKNVIQEGRLNGKIPTKIDQQKSFAILTEYLDKRTELQEANVNCYPLLVYNLSENEAYMNSEFIQEAKDIDGKWKPIEFTFLYEMCGTGKGFQSALEPKKYVAFSIIKYKGDFKTKIRVKFRNNRHIYYSNEIEGTINRSQFNQDFKKSYFESYGSNISSSDFDFYSKDIFLNE